MRYRQLDANDDFVFGAHSIFMVDSPATVAQAIKTRVRLFAGEWFLDLREGLDRENILGYGTQATRDHEIQQRILSTRGVTQLLSYSSSVDGQRGFTVNATADTLYGPVTIKEIL